MVRQGRSVRRLFLIVGAAAGLAGPTLGQVKYTGVAFSGQQAPGTAAGITFHPADLGFGFAYINNQGVVAFRAFVTGPGVGTENDAGIWCGAPAGLSLAAREGDVPPGMVGGGVYGTIDGPPTLSGDGRLAIRATLTGPGITFGINDQAIWSGPPGGLLLSAQRGSWAPGTGSTYASLGLPAANSFGQNTFDANLDLAVFNRGLWFGAPGSLTKLALEGEPAPGLDPGVNYATFDTITTAPNIPINSAGQVAFRGTVVGPGIGGANNYCLWGGTPGSLHLIAREGSAAADVGPGVNWGGFQEPVLTDSGAVAFRGWLVGGGISASNDFGIWRGFILGELDLVAREGDGAPGTPPGVVFSNLSQVPGPFGIPKMNNLNGVSFRGQVSGSGVTAANDTGMWHHNDDGALVLIAREGDAAPGAPAGTVFTGFNQLSPVPNNLNQVAFLASTGGGDGIWATDPYGAMHLVARVWEPIVIDGISRTPTFLRPITGQGVQDGSPTSFNDRGEIVIRADFIGETGIFIADVNDQCKPTVAEGPVGQKVALGDDAVFEVSTTGPGTHTFQWRREAEPIHDGPAPGGGTISGATTPTLTIAGVNGADEGSYDVLVTNLCGTRTSEPALLAIACYADCESDGDLDVFDYLCFLDEFASAAAYADCEGDGDWDVFDFLCFQGVFAAGCP